MRLGSEPIRHPPSAVSHYLAAPTASNALRAELCGSGEMTQMGVSITSNCTWTLQ
jgi:hypothetical protein